jgi:two-component system chemotaxis response regulator CheY
MVSVLLVEDDTNVHELLTKMLSVHGHEIVGEAFDGLEAVELFKKLGTRPEVILMDYRMPVMNGLEATKEILDIDPSARIIILTADNTIKDAALKSGVIGFLAKPISPVDIVASIEKHVSSACDLASNLSCTVN